MNNRRVIISATALALFGQINLAAAQATETASPVDASAIERAPFFSPAQMYGLTADLFIRSYFAELKALPNWTADHPAWSRNLGAYSAEMLGLLLPQGETLEAHVSSEVKRQLTERELAELNASVTAPEFISATKRLAEIGASWKDLVLVPTLIREPKYYSGAERARAKAIVSVLRGQASTDQIALKDALKPVALFIETPAFLKYQSSLGRTFTDDARSLGESAERRRGFEQLMQRWHMRLKSGA